MLVGGSRCWRPSGIFSSRVFSLQVSAEEAASFSVSFAATVCHLIVCEGSSTTIQINLREKILINATGLVDVILNHELRQKSVRIVAKTTKLTSRHRKDQEMMNPRYDSELTKPPGVISLVMLKPS